jgi:hypothetical protein
VEAKRAAWGPSGTTTWRGQHTHTAAENQRDSEADISVRPRPKEQWGGKGTVVRLALDLAHVCACSSSPFLPRFPVFRVCVVSVRRGAVLAAFCFRLRLTERRKLQTLRRHTDTRSSRKCTQIRQREEMEGEGARGCNRHLWVCWARQKMLFVSLLQGSLWLVWGAAQEGAEGQRPLPFAARPRLRSRLPAALPGCHSPRAACAVHTHEAHTVHAGTPQTRCCRPCCRRT